MLAGTGIVEAITIGPFRRRPGFSQPAKAPFGAVRHHPERAVIVTVLRRSMAGCRWRLCTDSHSHALTRLGRRAKINHKPAGS
jgi:hypothetical protein